MPLELRRGGQLLASIPASVIAEVPPLATSRVFSELFALPGRAYRLPSGVYTPGPVVTRPSGAPPLDLIAETPLAVEVDQRTQPLWVPRGVSLWGVRTEFGSMHMEAGDANLWFSSLSFPPSEWQANPGPYATPRALYWRGSRLGLHGVRFPNAGTALRIYTALDSLVEGMRVDALSGLNDSIYHSDAVGGVSGNIGLVLRDSWIKGRIALIDAPGGSGAPSPGPVRPGGGPIVFTMERTWEEWGGIKLQMWSYTVEEGGVTVALKDSHIFNRGTPSDPKATIIGILDQDGTPHSVTNTLVSPWPTRVKVTPTNFKTTVPTGTDPVTAWYAAHDYETEWRKAVAA